MATLSILGLYTFDNTLFDLMCWPNQFTQDDKTATINNILMEGAELEILYPDSSFMKSAIAAWSYKEKSVWQRIHTASLLEYNPIENYRRNETESIETSKTEQHSGNDTTSHSGTDTTNNTGKDTTAHTGTESSTSSNTNTASGSDSGTIDHKVTGYDSNTLVEQSQDSTTGTSNSQDTQTGQAAVTHNTQDEITHNTQVATTHNTQEQLTHGEKIEHTGDDARTLLAYGNIGVTTSQEMLEQEMDIAPKLNTISAIVDSFIKRFCILVY